jgi:hypothetical protein
MNTIYYICYSFIIIILYYISRLVVEGGRGIKLANRAGGPGAGEATVATCFKDNIIRVTFRTRLVYLRHLIEAAVM